MKRNLPARIKNDPDIKRLMRYLLEYIALRLVTLYTRRIIEKGAVLLVSLLFRDRRDRRREHYSF